MNRESAPTDTLDFITRLPVGALLRIEDKAFTNQKFQEITGYCRESPTAFVKCMQMLFGQRSKEMLQLFEQDTLTNNSQTRIVNIRTSNGTERWVEWKSIQNKEEEEIMLLWDVTHLWNTRTALMNRNRTLENQLFDRTEELEKAVNLLLSKNQMVDKNTEASQLLANILSINHQLLKVLADQLPDSGSSLPDILQQCSGSLQHMQDCCREQPANETLRSHLQHMQELLANTLDNLTSK